MTQTKAILIKNWIKEMGFKLTKRHQLEHRTKKINYYTLGNFGIYEEQTPLKRSASASEKKLKFISWTPWGDDFEINSVKELSEAYENFIKYNPSTVLN